MTSSSLMKKAKLRVLDFARRSAQGPNRVDVAAKVSRLAHVRGSTIHGPVCVDDYARLHRVTITGPVTIGKGSSLWGPGIYVEARLNPIEIGSYCSIARDVSLHGFGHDPTRISTHYIGRNVLGRPVEEEIISAGPIHIGHDVWIGAGSHILSGVSVGTGAVIGAGSVVSRDVPPYAIAVGTPATPVRYRFDEETIERLLASEWWTWSRDEIRTKEALFTQSLTPALIDEYLR
ncbi:MAG TPA: CatB-related O-acetyltransferase [Solirubrobacterales bacterium]|jgi:carbonic anhydrase/acetyltransferase-like protein (isoleucine patch superfamily)